MASRPKIVKYIVFQKYPSCGGDTAAQSLVLCKLDGVGPVDNRPSTDKLHHFVQINYMWHVTHDTWHLTRDMGHVTCDMLWGGEHSLQISAP